MSVTFTIPPCYVEHLCSRCPDCGLGPKIYPLDAKGKPIMPEETKDTPAADQHAAYLQELSTRVPQILRALEGLNLCEKKAVLSSALALVDVGFSLEVR